MPHLSLKNLTKSFDGVMAVDNVSMAINEGEFFSMLGPSGCGKSTTLRMLAGFESVTSGAIELDGKDVAPLPPERRGIGFVFQNYAIFPHMNVFDNIAFGLRIRNVPSAEIRSKVSAALDQVDLQGFEFRMQREMSGGQQQRVALARVLVTEPKILLLDEPLSALDKNLREEMKFWIKDLQTKLGITTIYVTHDQGEALTMSDRIAVMQGGQVAQIGTPREIYEMPDSLFVAKFIGESSILKGKVLAVDGDQCRLQCGAETVAAFRHHALGIGDQASIVLRPEQVRIGHAAVGEGWNRSRARVHSITYQGSSLRFSLDVYGQTIVSEMANRDDTPEFAPGDDVELSWRASSSTALPDGTI